MGKFDVAVIGNVGAAIDWKSTAICEKPASRAWGR
jgi:hypothetical protein